MVYYELMQITIIAPALAKIILNMVIWHHSLSNSIVSNHGSVFMSKFWFLLYYFSSIKQSLSTTFYSQINGLTKWQNCTIEVYLRAFVNYKQDNWARLLSMAKFAYNNTIYASTGYMSFKLNCGYHQSVFYKENVNPRFRSKAANELTKELKNLMTTWRENLQHAQELQKRAHNKRTKLKSYASSEKVWLNSKYIKTKCNQKLKAKFFGPFRVLHPLDSQAYKLELPK